MADRNFIRWGIFRQDDIDDNGEIKKGSPILGYYAPQYDSEENPLTFEGTTERWGEGNTYNGKVHEGRHYDILDTGDSGMNLDETKVKILKRNSPVKNRGISVLDYGRGRSKEGDYFDAAIRSAPFTGIDEIQKDALSYYDNTPGAHGTKYERLSAPLVSGGENSSFVKGEDEVHRLARLMADFTNIPEHRGENTIALPFVVTGDTDKIITLDKVLNKGFDPGRDYLNERQTEGYGVHRIIPGMFRTATMKGGDGDIVGQALMGEDKDYHKINSGLSGAVESLMDDFYYHTHGGELHPRGEDRGAFESNLKIIEDWANRIRSETDPSDDDINRTAGNMINIVETMRSAEDGLYSGDEKSIEKVTKLVRILHQLNDSLYQGMKKRPRNGRVLVPNYNRWTAEDWEKILKSHFDPDNPTNSDERMKNIESGAFRPADRSHANYILWHTLKELYDKELRKNLVAGLWRH